MTPQRVVERLGNAKRILDGTNAAEGLWHLFETLPAVELHEVFGILLQYHVPDRHNLLNFINLRPFHPPARPPSQAQIGFARDPDLWEDFPDASREDLWEYLLFRWTVKYFERTADLMLKSLNTLDQLPAELASLLALENSDLFMMSIVAYHGSLLDAVAPRVLSMLQLPSFCRDLTEHNELNQLSNFVLSSTAVPVAIKEQFPLDYFLRIAAGEHAHVHATALRLDALNTVAATSGSVLENWIRRCTDPSLITWLCRIMVDLPAEVHYIAIMGLTFADLMIDIAWDLDRHYLYEMTIHILLSVDPTRVSYALHAVLASHLFQRFALAFPRRNIIEGCFYTLSAILHNVPNTNPFRHQIEENLRTALTTNGNRGPFLQMVAWQEAESQAEWSYLFPQWQAPPSAPATLDEVTELPILRKWAFAPMNRSVVGLETILRQVAFNGLKNPFTNIAFTWDEFWAVNRDNQ